MGLAKAKRLEKRVNYWLTQLGGTPSPILEWDSTLIVRKIKEKEGGEELLSRLFGKVKGSYPDLQKWEDLSTSQILDLCLGVDLLMVYEDRLIVVDVTGNPATVHKKLCLMKGFRKAFLSDLGVTSFIVVLGSLHAPASSFKEENLSKALSKLLLQPGFYTQVVKVI